MIDYFNGLPEADKGVFLETVSKPSKPRTIDWSLFDNLRDEALRRGLTEKDVIEMCEEVRHDNERKLA